MPPTPEYEVTVVGGGPSGLSTAMYTTRLGHRTALVDAGDGRHAAVEHVHNLVGISEATTGRELSEIALDQLVSYGTDYYRDRVESVGIEDGDSGRRFRVAADRATFPTDRIVLATGFADEPPGIEGLERFTGRGLHYCIHCDAYTLADESVFVLGHDDHAAEVALMMLNFTADVDLLPTGREPEWSDDRAAQLADSPVTIDDREVVGAFPRDDRENPWLGGLEFADGTSGEYVGGFAVYGRTYNNGLARDLGCDLNEDGSVAVDEDRRTSVEGVYAVGDLTHGQNQTPIAMGDGAYAGIALHKDLRTFPRPLEEVAGEETGATLDEDEVEDEDHPSAPAIADDLRARMRRVRETGADAGLRPPKYRDD